MGTHYRVLEFRHTLHFLTVQEEETPILKKNSVVILCVLLLSGSAARAGNGQDEAKANAAVIMMMGDDATEIGGIKPPPVVRPIQGPAADVSPESQEPQGEQVLSVVNNGSQAPSQALGGQQKTGSSGVQTCVFQASVQSPIQPELYTLGLVNSCATCPVENEDLSWYKAEMKRFFHAADLQKNLAASKTYPVMVSELLNIGKDSYCEKSVKLYSNEYLKKVYPQ